MSDVSEVFTGRSALARLVAPLANQIWTILLVVTVGTLATLAFARMQAPQFEASAVVQVQDGTGAASVAEHILDRDNLLSIATRHGLVGAGASRDAIAVQMRKAVSINDLTTAAGQALGYAPQVAGLVVSVLLPDAEASARVANDLAQQILDQGNSGRLNARQEELDFYRRDELRLWQEVSALKAEQDQAAADGTVGAADAAIAGQRQLMLMQDQYGLVRQKLAESEIDDRLARHMQAGQFSLLRRATAAEAVTVMQNWMLVGIAGSLLLAVTLAFVLERRYPALRGRPWHRLAGLRDGVARFYRLFDDPDRPILGVPRYLVTSALIVVWLYVFANLIR